MKKKLIKEKLYRYGPYIARYEGEWDYAGLINMQRMFRIVAHSPRCETTPLPLLSVNETFRIDESEVKNLQKLTVLERFKYGS